MNLLYSVCKEGFSTILSPCNDFIVACFVLVGPVVESKFTPPESCHEHTTILLSLVHQNVGNSAYFFLIFVTYDGKPFLLGVDCTACSSVLIQTIPIKWHMLKKLSMNTI